MRLKDLFDEMLYFYIWYVMKCMVVSGENLLFEVVSESVIYLSVVGEGL